jgi:two-component system NtrC family sensor kinase
MNGLMKKIFYERLLENPVYRALVRNMMITIISVSMVPMILVSSTLYLQFSNSYRGKINDHLRELVQKHQQNIDSFLEERLTDIRLMATRYGHERLKDTAFLKRNLDLLQQEYGSVFVDLGVVDAAGRQEAYAGPFKLGQADYGDAEWFKLLKERDQVISDVFLGLRGLPHFIVAVRTTDDGAQWALRATIDFAAFNNLVDKIRIGRTGLAFILNREGKLQTTPGSRPVPGGGPVDGGLSRDLWGLMASGQQDVRVSIAKDTTGQEFIYAGALLKKGDWLLVYQQSATDAFADLGDSFTLTTLIMVVGAAAVLVMALVLSGRMVNRIARVNDEKQLMNQKVVETGKLASIGELAAGVAHEINNPVAIMVEEAGWIGDLLEEEDLRETSNLQEFKRSLAQIKTQGRRCKEITHKLLSFARETSLKVQEVQINELLEDIVAISAQRAKYGKVEILTHLKPGLPEVTASLSEMQQVFLNLINNALDAMDKKGGRLSLSTRAEDAQVVVEVADTGAGIPAPYLGRIFDPFFTTKPVGKGTGLGLSICYGIVKRMRGRLEVKSTVGAGSTFSVYLPIAPSA